MDEIERLQEILLLIRRTVGWTAEEFGDKIGVTRQTINNLEAKRNNLTKTQYIAIRAVLDAEINNSSQITRGKDGKNAQDVLAYLLDVFVDHPEKYNEHVRKELLTKANMITPSILAGTASKSQVYKELLGIIAALGVTVGPIGIGVAKIGMAYWLKKALKKEDD